ncbi:MAG: phage tail tape measure protein [Candidatus Ventricola sp.]
MDEGTIKNRIVIEGEAEYKKALAEINRALKESKSELKAVAAEYAASGNSAKGLTAQIATLEKTHAQQSEQLAMMQEHLDKVTAAYGENSREAVDLRTKINNARAEMAKTSGELAQLRTRLDAAGDAMDDLGDGTGGAADGMAQVGEQARSAQDDVEELSKSITDMMGEKLITLGIGKEVVSKLGSQLAEMLRGAIASAMQGQTEDAMTRALAGDDALSERRTAIKDAVDRTWAAYRDGSQTVSDVAAVDTVLGNKGITDEDTVKRVTDMAITLDQVFGQDVQSTLDRATSMVNTFGGDYETYIDLMTKGMRDMSDGGTQMLSAFETYPQLFAQIGYDADDMYSSIATAANDVNLGKDSAFVKGVETFVTTLTSGSKESQETLKTLGIEATDLPKKFQAGGEAAAAATQLVLTKLMAIEDVSKRNDLGKALFGDKVWTDSAGGIVDVILSGYGQIVDASGATKDAMDAVLGTFDAQFAGLKERVGQQSDAVLAPAVDAATEALSVLNQHIDSEGGSITKGVTATLQQARENMGTMAADSFTALQDHIKGMSIGAADAIGSACEQIAAAGSEQSAAISAAFFGGAEQDTDEEAAGETAQRWVDVLRGNVESKAAEQEQSEALSGMLAGMLPDDTVLTDAAKTFAASHKSAIVGQMTEAYGQEEDEDFKAWQDFQTAMIESAADESLVAAMELGEDEAQETIDAISYSSPAARRMAEYFGGQLVDGTEDGAEGMYDAGANAAQGAIEGARSGEDAMYSAGAALGGAFRRGFQDKMLIKSPSRAAMEDMAYVTEGYLEQAERDRSRIAGGAAALADALREGFGRPELAMPEIASGGGGLSAGALAQAIREELDGMAFYLDAESMSVRLEPYVSRATSDRVSASAQGQSNLSRSW